MQRVLCKITVHLVNRLTEITEYDCGLTTERAKEREELLESLVRGGCYGVERCAHGRLLATATVVESFNICSAGELRNLIGIGSREQEARGHCGQFINEL